MPIDNILNDIQNSCKLFLDQNFSEILNTINENKTIISTPLKGFELNKPELVNAIGVYTFYIKSNITIDSVETLKHLWDTNSKENRLHSPAVIIKRFKKIVKDEWVCFYVGKSLKLNERLNQHIDQKTKYTTYGLKLSEHDRLNGVFDFAYSYYVLHTNGKGNLDAKKCLNVTLESHLRETLIPLIGKQ